jgi:hypothetical protein
MKSVSQVIQTPSVNASQGKVMAMVKQLHVEIEDGCAMRCDSYEISKCDTHASRMASSPIGVMSDDDGGGGGGDGGGGGGGGGEVRHLRITNGILAHGCAVGTTATRPDASLGSRSKQHQRRPWRVRWPALQRDVGSAQRSACGGERNSTQPDSQPHTGARAPFHTTFTMTKCHRLHICHLWQTMAYAGQCKL